MTIAKKKPAKNATKLKHARAIWAELANLTDEDRDTLTKVAIDTSQIQSRFWDIWSDQHRGNNSEIIMRQAYEARKRGEDTNDELVAMPDGLWSYLQSAAAEEFERVHRRVIDLLSNRFIKALNVKVPVMGNLQTWRCVLLGAVDRPYHVGLGIIPFDSGNAKIFIEGDDITARLIVRIVRGAEPLTLRLRLGGKQKLANGEPRFAQLLDVARGKSPLKGGWLFRAKFGRWCAAFAEAGRRTGRGRSVRKANRVATIKGSPTAALLVECGEQTLQIGGGQVRYVSHIRRLATEQLYGRRYGVGGAGRIGHGRKRRRKAELPWTDAKWQRVADRVCDQLAFDVTAATGRLGAGTVVYHGGDVTSALQQAGISEHTPRSFCGWQWHDLGTKIAAKLAIEGATLERRDGYFAGEEGGKSKPRKKKRGKTVEAANK